MLIKGISKSLKVSIVKLSTLNKMTKMTVWNPWGMLPRDFVDWAEDLVPMVGENQLDMYETTDSVVVKVKAAGFAKDDISLDIEANHLTISGNSKATTEEENKDKKYYRKEIKNMSFTRSVDLPTLVVADKAAAVFKDGVLTITLPKSEEAKPKKIEIQVQ